MAVTDLNLTREYGVSLVFGDRGRVTVEVDGEISEAEAAAMIRAALAVLEGEEE